MTSQDNPDAEALLAAITETGKALEQGEKIYRDLRSAMRRMRTVLWVALVGIVADLLLSGAFGVVLNNQSHLNDQVKQNQANIKQVECDLNGVFIKADTPSARDRSPDKAAYDSNYHLIYLQRMQLGCEPPMAEPVRPPS